MYRYWVVLVLVVLFLKNGSTLRCYSTIFLNKANTTRFKHTIKYCNETINEVRKNLGLPDGKIKSDVVPDLRCFTTILVSHYREDKELKGCFPKDGCQELSEIFQGLVEKGHFKAVHCHECEGDECNMPVVKLSDPTGSASMKGTHIVILYLTTVSMLMFNNC